MHPPFQIDGNFGATAGMPEMLLQSHEGYISLLPAVPDQWKEIRFKGLKARGNFTLSCEYCNGKIERCEIESAVGGTVLLRCEKKDEIRVTEKSAGIGIGTENRARLTYKIVAFSAEEPDGGAEGCVGYLHPADRLETERYLFRFRQNNLNISR